MIGKISLQTKRLLIIVSLIIVPKLILAIVDFLAASGKAAKTSTMRCGSPRVPSCDPLSTDMPMRHTTRNGPILTRVVRIRPTIVRIWSGSVAAEAV